MKFHSNEHKKRFCLVYHKNVVKCYINIRIECGNYTTTNKIIQQACVITLFSCLHDCYQSNTKFLHPITLNFKLKNNVPQVFQNTKSNFVLWTCSKNSFFQWMQNSTTQCFSFLEFSTLTITVKTHPKQSKVVGYASQQTIQKSENST